jgi:RNA polymerase sigma-70 factor (TIGR02943 family)
MSFDLKPDTWIDAYGDYLYSIAYYKTSNAELAKDLVQEVFLAALKAKDSFEGKSSVKTWLTAILKNKIIDHYRKSANNDSLDEYIIATEDSFGNSFFDSDNSGRWKEKITSNYISESADEYLLGKEFQHFLNECLLKLPPKLKIIFLAKYFDELDSEIICKENNISSSNYWVIIYRAKVLLRACLEKKGMMH